MLNTNNQNFESPEIVLSHIDKNTSENTFTKTFSKIKLMDAELVKFYLGMGYFFVTSIALILLIF